MIVYICVFMYIWYVQNTDTYMCLRIYIYSMNNVYLYTYIMYIVKRTKNSLTKSIVSGDFFSVVC